MSCASGLLTFMSRCWPCWPCGAGPPNNAPNLSKNKTIPPTELPIADEVHVFETRFESARNELPQTAAVVKALVDETQQRLDKQLATKPTSPHDPAMAFHLMAALAADRGCVASFQENAESTGETLIKFMKNVDNEFFELVLSSFPEGYDDSAFDEGPAQQRWRSDCRQRIARVVGVSAEAVVIGKVRRGSVISQFAIDGLTKEDKLKIITSDGKFKEEFSTFQLIYAKASSYVMQFKQSDFDTLGDKRFDQRDQPSFPVGPAGKKKDYIQPEGWDRVGLKVLGKYDGGDDTWLTPFGGEGNWYRCYHGAARGSSQEKTHGAMEGIAKKGLKGASNVARGGVIGVSAYVSCDMDYAELYAGEYDIPVESGKLVKMRVAFQMAVRSDLEFVETRGEVQDYPREWFLDKVREYPQTLPSYTLKSGPNAGRTCSEVYGEFEGGFVPESNKLVEWIVTADLKNVRPYGMLFKAV